MEIHHDSVAHVFSVELDGERAVLEYGLRDGAMTIMHTGVPDAIGGRGIAAELMRAALDVARAAGLKVIPVCSYAAAFFKRHPEYAHLLG